MAVITFPASPSPGDVYTANKVTYRYDGTVTDGKWVSLGAANGGNNTDDIIYDDGLGTNQVSRGLTSRLNDYVSVKDFGALGDGTTDDSAKIKNAIDYLDDILDDDIDKINRKYQKGDSRPMTAE